MALILNLLPLTPEEREDFRRAAGDGSQVFLPMEGLRCRMDRIDPALLDQAEVILGNLPPAQLARCGRLRWLQTWSAGTDSYAGALPAGAMLTSAVGAYGPSVSEHMFACLLALMKRLPAYRDNQRERVWRDEGKAMTLRGATVLLLGTGDLGSHLARLCGAMGARTVGLNRHPRPLDGFDLVRSMEELDRWLPQAQVVAMSLPGSPETYHLMDERRLELLGEDAILLNGGRGTAVDCLALAEVLKEGRIRGAALDVTEPEPLPPDHPLWDCPNLLLTPHAAGGAHLDLTVRNVCAIALDNLRRYLAGEELRNRAL